MNDRPTVWIMLRIDIAVQENSDSRYTSRELFDDVSCIQADTREEVLAIAFGQRESNKKHEPTGIYDSGQKVRFIGPFQVEHNAAWPREHTIDTYFEDYNILDEKRVNEEIDRALVLYQLTK